MAAPSDLGFPIQKRVTTYGKVARRKPAAPPFGRLRNEDSTTDTSTSTTARGSPVSSPEPEPSFRATASRGRNRPPISRSGRTAPPRLLLAQSQPIRTELSTIASQSEEDLTAKRRKLTRTFSEKKVTSTASSSAAEVSPYDAYDVYDFPSPTKVAEKTIPRSVPKTRPLASARKTPEKDVKMKDAGQQSMPFSVKTSRAFENLRVSSKRLDENRQQIPLRLSRDRPRAPVHDALAQLLEHEGESVQQEPEQPALLKPPPTKKRPSPPPSSSGSQNATGQAPRKKRLIDALAAQAEDSSSGEEEDIPSQEGMQPEDQRPFALQNSSPPPSLLQQNSRTVVRPAITTKKSGPKFTYSQQRSMLAEQDPLLDGIGLGGLDGESAGGSLFNFSSLKTSTITTFSFLDDDDETVNTGAVRSIHELRQAGQNSRFADEIEDILDRIGSPSAKPSSLRRGALLELAQKMREKNFRRQYRNHSGDASLFRSLGEESDMIAGFSIVAILVTLLAASVSAHLIQQLPSQGLAELLSRLLGEPIDIVQFAKDRKQNASRNAQTSLGSIKSGILDLPVWEPASPTSLSPRTLALKCLDLIMRQSSGLHLSGETEIFSTAVTDKLFSILSANASDQKSWDFPSQQESHVFYLALHVLEGHSVSAMQSRRGSLWTSQYVPIVADLLETALRRPADRFGDIENLALRITLNIANNNTDGSGMFVNKGLLQELAESACGSFEAVLKSIRGGDGFLSKSLESLIMMLGVMINFCEHYAPASQSLDESGPATGTPPLDRLVRVFADYHSKTSDANSMEETQLNVAFGYLSILLGYLCLYGPIRDKFISIHPKKNLDPLLESITEFIIYFHKVAEAAAKAQGGSKQESESAARLQSLVDRLELHR
ncbi:wings apart-like protein 1 [Diplogelasinospora grovesii]|uniref:Wings apart-like protein 1 n=1 Tax=Diplogelasinospora grovesii TaxID=303347 RepID=A0AAN6NK08_9PEZI|nr:wings apart-like protein 1 [Diplogelasinospora grovesii]